MFQVSGWRKELLPSLPKTQPTHSLVESLAPCLLVSWSELPPLRPEDFDLILLGPLGIHLIPCLLSLHGWLWITPKELQLRSLHWTSCLLRGVYQGLFSLSWVDEFLLDDFLLQLDPLFVLPLSEEFF